MSRECECKETSVEPKYQQSITISMEEYKELLIIKGKYEEAPVLKCTLFFDWSYSNKFG